MKDVCHDIETPRHARLFEYLRHENRSIDARMIAPVNGDASEEECRIFLTRAAASFGLETSMPRRRFAFFSRSIKRRQPQYGLQHVEV